MAETINNAEFAEYLKGQKLAPTTIRNHLRNVVNFQFNDYNIFGDEKTIIENVKSEYKVGSEQQTIISSISKYRTFKELPNEKIREYLKVALENTLKLNAEKNKQLLIPPLQFFKEMMMSYFNEGKYKEYVVLYLLITYHTRNADLVVDIVKSVPFPKREKDKNYLIIRPKSILYVRNMYKTAGTYGSKEHSITNHLFYDAVEALESKTLLIDDDHLTRQVKKITGGYSEADIVKTALAGAKGIKKIAEISKKRGTNMETLAKSYDIL
jgi:hypothetical protein